MKYRRISFLKEKNHFPIKALLSLKIFVWQWLKIQKILKYQPRAKNIFEWTQMDGSGILLPKFFWPTVRKNCSNDREKLFKFKVEGLEFAKFLRSLKQFIQIVKGQVNFCQQNAFLTCFWRFLRSNKLEQLEFNRHT